MEHAASSEKRRRTFKEEVERDDEEDDGPTTMPDDLPSDEPKRRKGSGMTFTIIWHQPFLSWKVSSRELPGLADVDRDSWRTFVEGFIKKRFLKCESCLAKVAHNCEKCRALRAQDFWLQSEVREFVESKQGAGSTLGSVVLPITLGQMTFRNEPVIHLYFRCRRDSCTNAAEQSSQLCDTHGRTDRGLSSEKFLELGPVFVCATKDFQIWRLPQEEDLVISVPLAYEPSELKLHSLVVKLSTDAKLTDARKADLDIFPTFCRRTDRIIEGQSPLCDLRVKRTWLIQRKAAEFGLTVRQEAWPLDDVRCEARLKGSVLKIASKYVLEAFNTPS
eukprot:m.121902 g.121902  ORF g.121902 m.121902 type:complete len:333 (+) comp52105_c0_seq2:1532-2530(+)